MVVFIILVVIAVIVYLVVQNNKKEDQARKPASSMTQNQRLMEKVKNVGSNSYGNYWKSFKARKPVQAKEIESICKHDLSKLSDKDAFEIVTTLLRWSQNAGVSIGNLKNWFLSQFEEKSSGLPYEQAIDTLKREKIKEAQQFNISPDHTACNFMIEFLVEKQEKERTQSLGRKIAENLNVPEDKIDDFLREIEEKEAELNLAPDISRLDREENKLFHLAEDGVNMLDNLTVGFDKELTLTEQGKAEALVLCSTLVMTLHSNFQNEIDLDVQADRYFLLLHDNTLDFDVDDNIDFLNSRIDFYNKEVKKALQLNPLQLFTIDNAMGILFNTLYLHPGNTNPYNINRSEISPNDLVMFRGQLEKVVKYMNSGRARIVGNSPTEHSEYRSKALELFQSLAPASKRAMMNKDVAWLISDQFISMIKDGKLNPGLPLPQNIKDNFQYLISLKSKHNLSDADIEEILEDVQNEFINSFSE